MRYLKLSLLTCCCYALSLSVIWACECCSYRSNICSGQQFMLVKHLHYEYNFSTSPNPLEHLDYLLVIDPLNSGVEADTFVLNSDSNISCSSPVNLWDTMLLAFTYPDLLAFPDSITDNYAVGTALGCANSALPVQNGHFTMATKNGYKTYAIADAHEVIADCPLATDLIKKRGHLRNFVDNEPLTNVNIPLGAFGNLGTHSDGSFSYDFAVYGEPLEINSEATPDFEVSTLDLIRLRKHLLNIEPFTHPGQYLAADVNGSNTVTTLDLIMIHKFLIGVVDEFSIGSSWIFSGGAGTGSPGSEGWIESLRVYPDGSNCYQDELNLYPVKIGDVNWSAFD